MRTRFHALILATALTQGAALAAYPPSTMGYQGVLRDAADRPRTGTFDMVFSFFDAQTAGNVLVVDRHTAAAGGMVAVTNGLFNVQLGTGISVGAGGGTYLSLADMFRDYTDVWMEVSVGAETLSPRTKVQASAYALNSGLLGGNPASSFLDTSSVPQTKSGTLTVTSTFPDAITGSYFGATGILGSAPFNVGVVGYGGNAGGCFAGTWGSEVTIANDTTGAQVVGQSTGGSFWNNTGAGSATVSTGETGIVAHGTDPGSAGHFEEMTYTGRADIGAGVQGVVASGSYIAGRFISNTGRYRAELGTTGWEAGGFFDAPFAGISTVVADAYGFGIATNGPKAFIQNHPTDPSRLMAYIALEGPEVGTYTRGSGSIRGREARIVLDRTFALTTDPDIGLTAVVTPRRPHADLYVASVSTTELVVRSGAASTGEVAFDYVVNGLRVGFENHPVIFESSHFPNATVPSPEAAASRLAAMPEDSRASTPLARLSAVCVGSGAEAAEPSGARALIAGINSPEHALHARTVDEHVVVAPAKDRPSPSAPAGASPATLPDAPDQAARTGSAGAAPGRTSEPDPGGEAVQGEIPSSFSLPVETEVRPGDVVSNDPEMPGSLRLAAEAGDPGVVGVVVGPEGGRFQGQAPIAPAGRIVPCNADASDRPIAVGDLLVASGTPGFAMRAEAHPRRGTVLGKALEPLPAGTGTIRILVMPR